MLVLTRKNRESIVIGRPDDQKVVLEITILSVEGGRVRLGFQADNATPIHRREVWDRIHGELASRIGGIGTEREPRRLEAMIGAAASVH